MGENIYRLCYANFMTDEEIIQAYGKLLKYSPYKDVPFYYEELLPVPKDNIKKVFQQQMLIAIINSKKDQAAWLKDGLFMLDNFLPREHVIKIAEGIQDGRKRLASNKKLPSEKEKEAMKMLAKWGKEFPTKED